MSKKLTSGGDGVGRSPSQTRPAKFSTSDPKDSADTYDYFTRLNAFSTDGIVAPALHSTMTGR